MNREYNIKLSNTVKTISAVVVLLVAIAIVTDAIVIMYNTSDTTAIVTSISVITAVVLVVIGTYAFSPKKIVLDVKTLCIKRRFGSRTINLSDIKSIKRSGGHLRDVRLFGSGGLFGFFGWFSSTNDGRYFAYAGDLNNTAMIETASRKYLVSSDNIDELVSEANKRI